MRAPVNVYITVDTEVWCDRWDHLDEQFPEAYERYVFGRGPRQCAMPYTLEVLRRHGLSAVFFVEPLFSARFGDSYLRTLVEMIQRHDQDVQLHVHPEWTDEITPAVFPGRSDKRQHLKFYSSDEQTELIRRGLRLLAEAGAADVCAFRAGTFAANFDTYRALARTDIRYDASLNFRNPVCAPDMRESHDFEFVSRIEGVWSYPLSMFNDALGRLRQYQIGSCSFSELREAIIGAANLGWRDIVILSHNFEMLRRETGKPDPIVVRRFEKLCAFLDAERSRFRTATFRELPVPEIPPSRLPRPRVGIIPTGVRDLEQIVRRARALVARERPPVLASF